MNTIYLHGSIGKKFGKKWRISASSCEEVIKAIDSNSEGFVEHVIKQALEGNEHYMIAKNPKDLESDQDFIDSLVKDVNKQKEIHIVPKLYGGFIASAIAAITTLSATSTAVVAMSAAIWGAVSQLAISALTKTDPDTKNTRGDKSVSTKSLMLAASREAATDGGIVPLGYGRMFVGPKLIGQSISSFRTFINKKPEDNSMLWLESSNDVTFDHVLSEGPIEGAVNEYGELLDLKNDPSLIFKSLYINETQVRKGNLYNYILNEQDKASLPKIFYNGVDDDESIRSASTIYTYNQELFGVSPYYDDSKDEYISVEQAFEGMVVEVEDILENTESPKVFSHKISEKNVQELVITFRATCAVTLQENAKNLRENVYFGVFLLDSYGNRINVGSVRNYIPTDSQFFQNNRFSINTSSVYGSRLVDESGEEIGVFLDEARDQSTKFKVSGIATSAYQFEIKISFDEPLGKETPTLQIVKLTKELDVSAASNIYTTWTTTKRKWYGAKKVTQHSKTDWNSIGGQGRSRSISVSTVEERILGNFSYPHTAMSRMTIDSLNFASQPTIMWHLKLKKVLIPSNYDPITRTYDGPWNGLFKGQQDGESIHSISDDNKYWTDNPAWIFYDLISNPTYGCGKYGVEEYDIDKWQLYKIAKYCDQLVETNFPLETPQSIPFSFSYTGFASSGDDITLKILDFEKAQFVSDFAQEPGINLDPEQSNIKIYDRPENVEEILFTLIGGGGSGEAKAFENLFVEFTDSYKQFKTWSTHKFPIKKPGFNGCPSALQLIDEDGNIVNSFVASGGRGGYSFLEHNDLMGGKMLRLKFSGEINEKQYIIDSYVQTCTRNSREWKAGSGTFKVDNGRGAKGTYPKTKLNYENLEQVIEIIGDGQSTIGELADYNNCSILLGSEYEILAYGETIILQADPEPEYLEQTDLGGTAEIINEDPGLNYESINKDASGGKQRNAHLVSYEGIEYEIELSEKTEVLKDLEHNSIGFLPGIGVGSAATDMLVPNSSSMSGGTIKSLFGHGYTYGSASATLENLKAQYPNRIPKSWTLTDLLIPWVKSSAARVNAARLQHVTDPDDGQNLYNLMGGGSGESKTFYCNLDGVKKIRVIRGAGGKQNISWWGDNQGGGIVYNFESDASRGGAAAGGSGYVWLQDINSERSPNPSRIIESSTRDQFVEYFGDGDSFKGKSIACFINQHNYESRGLIESETSEGVQWSEQVTYNTGDTVGYFGVEYQCLVDDSIGSRPDTSTSEWDISDAEIIRQEVVEKSKNRENCINKRSRIISSDPDKFEIRVSTKDIPFSGGVLSNGLLANYIYGACAVEQSYPILEPRFTSNLYLKSPSESLEILNTFASMFRSRLSYSSGKISLKQDSPSSPILLFSESSVSDKGFVYAGSEKNQRFSVVKVSYLDKYDDYRQNYVYEEDASAIEKIGLIETEVTGLSVSTESEARRLAKWILLSSQYEKEIVKFTCGQEGAYAFPGSIIQIYDSMRFEGIRAGRILNKFIVDESKAAFLLDKPVIFDPIVSDVQISIHEPVENTTLLQLDELAKSEDLTEDQQDSQIEKLNTPQIKIINARIVPSDSDEQSAVILSDLSKGAKVKFLTEKNVVEYTNHGFKDGDEVRFRSDGFLPQGVFALRPYYVIVIDVNTFEISRTQFREIATKRGGKDHAEHILPKPPGTKQEDQYFSGYSLQIWYWTHQGQYGLTPFTNEAFDDGDYVYFNRKQYTVKDVRTAAANGTYLRAAKLYDPPDQNIDPIGKIFVGVNLVEIKDSGKDKLMNQGGDHFVVIEGSGSANSIFSETMIGSSYSIKGNIAYTKDDKYSITSAQLQNIGVSQSLFDGWMSSEIFGKIRIADSKWMYAQNLGWVYMSEFLNRDNSSDDYFWFYTERFGWVGTTESLKTSRWLVPSIPINNLSHGTGLVDIFYDDVSGNISNLFIHSSSESTSEVVFIAGSKNGTPAKFDVISGIETEFVGDYINISENLYQQEGVADPNISAPISFENQIIDSSFFYPIKDLFAKYERREKLPILIREANESWSGKRSVQIKVGEGYFSNIIDFNYKLYIGNSTNHPVAAQLVKSWGFVKVDEETIELVNSESETFYGEHRQKVEDVVNSNPGVLLPIKVDLFFIKDLDAEYSQFMKGQEFSVVQNKEIEKGQYEIIASEYQPDKFANIDSKNMNLSSFIASPPTDGLVKPDDPGDLEIDPITENDDRPSSTSYKITIEDSSGGSEQIIADHQNGDFYEAGKTVELVASPGEGKIFSHWEISKPVLGASVWQDINNEEPIFAPDQFKLFRRDNLHVNSSDSISMNKTGDVVAVSYFHDPGLALGTEPKDNYIKVFRVDSSGWNQVGEDIKLERSETQSSSSGIGYWPEGKGGRNGFSVNISNDGNILVASMPAVEINGTYIILIFELIEGENTTSWQLRQKLHGSLDSFGWNVAISGDASVIVASSHVNWSGEGSEGDESSSFVKFEIYEYNPLNNAWIRKDEDNPLLATNSHHDPNNVDFRYSERNAHTPVDVSDDGSVIAISFADSDFGGPGGFVRILQYNDGSLQQIGEDLYVEDSDGNQRGAHNISLSANGEVIAFAGNPKFVYNEPEGQQLSGTTKSYNYDEQLLFVYKRDWSTSKGWSKMGYPNGLSNKSLYEEEFEGLPVDEWEEPLSQIYGKYRRFADWIFELNRDGTMLYYGLYDEKITKIRASIYDFDKSAWIPFDSRISKLTLGRDYVIFPGDISINQSGSVIAWVDREAIRGSRTDSIQLRQINDIRLSQIKFDMPEEDITVQAIYRTL